MRKLGKVCTYRRVNNKTATLVRGELDSAIERYVPMSKKKHLSKEAFRKISVAGL